MVVVKHRPVILGRDHDSYSLDIVQMIFVMSCSDGTQCRRIASCILALYIMSYNHSLLLLLMHATSEVEGGVKSDLPRFNLLSRYLVSVSASR